MVSSDSFKRRRPTGSTLERGLRQEPPEASRVQLWQSAGVRRVSFFSSAYLVAALRIIGLMMVSSLSYQSDEKFHFAPS
jgi:hypothetical protein